jgi:hypothetical protein
VDPISNNLRLFKILRPRDAFKRVLIGKKEGSASFYELIPYVFSTTDINFVTRWIKEGHKVKSKVDLLFRSLAEFTPPCSPSDPSLLSIDIEGQELNCLQSIDFDFYCPRVICVEEWEETITNGESKVREYLTLKNYSLIG